jgi:Rrf2 family protein
MMKLSRVVDYGILISCHLIRESERGKEISTAREIATATAVSLPMVSKILKSLVRNGIVGSARGLKGGYAVTPQTRSLSLGQLIRALDGPVRLTDCSPGAASGADCELQSTCTLSGTIARLNQAIQSSFDNVPLAEIALPGSRTGSRPLELPAHRGAVAPLPATGASGRLG